MSRKDYRVIADVLKRHGNEPRHKLAEHFANALAQVEGQFDRGRFLAACEEGGK